MTASDTHSMGWFHFFFFVFVVVVCVSRSVSLLPLSVLGAELCQ